MNRKPTIIPFFRSKHKRVVSGSESEEEPKKKLASDESGDENLTSAKADDLFGDADDISSDDDGEGGRPSKKIHGLDDDEGEGDGDLVIADRVSNSLRILSRCEYPLKFIFPSGWRRKTRRRRRAYTWT